MRLILLASALLAPTLVAAQTPAPASGEQLFGALDGCRKQADAARLACYDAAVDRLLAAREKREIRVVDRAAVIKTRRNLFGFSTAAGELFDDGKKDETAEVREITTTVSKALDSQVGLWTIAVAQGSVWQTLEPSTFFTPKSGDTIVLRAELLGRFTAQVGKGRRVPVKRVR